jgi:hypothetical protein
MNEMLAVLADKYKIDKTNEIWHLELFNRLCSQLDFETQMLAEREDNKKYVAFINSDRERLAKTETFVLDLFSGKKVSPIVKEKLRTILADSDLQISQDNDGNFFIH